MKPLNLIFSIKSNIRRYLNQMSAIILSVFIMYFFCVIGGGIQYGIKTAMYRPYEKMSFISGIGQPAAADKYQQDLELNKAVDKVLYTNYNSIMLDGIIGGLDIPFITLSHEDINYVYNRLNLKTLEGSLPEGNDDIFINKLAAEQFGLKTGDYFGKKVNENHRIEGKYRVSGIYEGNEILILRYNDSVKNKADDGLMIIAKDNRISEINSYIDNIKDNNISIVNLTKIKASTESAFETLKLAAIAIMVIVALVVTVIISNINFVNLMDRLGELSILHSMGYSRKFLTRRVFLEGGILLAAGGIIGIILSIIGSLIFKVLFCMPRGLLVEAFDKWYVIIVLGLIALVIMFVSVPTVRFIKKINMSEILEGNY